MKVSSQRWLTLWVSQKTRCTWVRLVFIGNLDGVSLASVMNLIGDSLTLEQSKKMGISNSGNSISIDVGGDCTSASTSVLIIHRTSVSRW
jgi:hypothetical protein